MTYHDGLRIFSQTDLTWWQPGALPASAANLGTVLSGSNQVGDWVEVETLKAGQKRIWVNVGGKRSRLGIFKTDPTASIYLLSPPPPHVGRASIRLSKASGFAFDDAGAPQNTVPKGATALPLKAPDPDTKAQWSRDLSKLRGAATTITWATLLDLDQDDADEGFACVAGGADDQDCYVIEPTQAAPHYLGVSTMRFDGGPADAAPKAFKKGQGIYVMHATGSGDTARLWVARYDGGGYIVEGVR
ncbi:MAG: hypothetical protein GXP62_16390 [Oligoflexia bacterium]|nr:hypothetical protein [Oligoflexia bacterium]